MTRAAQGWGAFREKKAAHFGLRKLEQGSTAEGRHQGINNHGSAAKVAGTKTKNSLVKREQEQ